MNFTGGDEKKNIQPLYLIWVNKNDTFCNENGRGRIALQNKSNKKVHLVQKKVSKRFLRIHTYYFHIILILSKHS